MMRRATAVASIAGVALLFSSFVLSALQRMTNGVLLSTALLLTCAGAALGWYIRRGDRQLDVRVLDGAGYTLAARSQIGLWDPARDGDDLVRGRHD